jgi:hypothetical protein
MLAYLAGIVHKQQGHHRPWLRRILPCLARPIRHFKWILYEKIRALDQAHYGDEARLRHKTSRSASHVRQVEGVDSCNPLSVRADIEYLRR